MANGKFKPVFMFSLGVFGFAMLLNELAAMFAGRQFDYHLKGAIMFLMGSFSTYLITINSIFLFGSKKNITSDMVLVEDKSTTGKRDQQHQIILAVIDTLNYEPLQIPTGGKAKIKDICLKRVRVFTDDGFKRAWQEGLDAGLFRLLESDKFSSK